MCECLGTTSEVTDDQEEMNSFYQQDKLVESHWLASRYAQTAPLLGSVKSDFTTLMNRRAQRIISTPLCSSLTCSGMLKSFENT